MQHPDFKHRATPDGIDYEEYSSVDLVAFVNDTSEKIGRYADSVHKLLYSDQIELDPKSIEIMSQLSEIESSVADIKVMVEWFLENHDFSKITSTSEDAH